jgi:hypothetical protein
MCSRTRAVVAGTEAGQRTLSPEFDRVHRKAILRQNVLVREHAEKFTPADGVVCSLEALREAVLPCLCGGLTASVVVSEVLLDFVSGGR